MDESNIAKEFTGESASNGCNVVTYEVWIDIEEYDAIRDTYTECDAPGGQLATFDSYDEAYDFASQIDNTYSTYRRCDAANADGANTDPHVIDATTTAPQGTAHAIAA